MPGFDIKNATMWPLEISLGMLGPMYWGVTLPGDTFSRGTGAVWFTIQATVSLDRQEHITTGGAVWDIFKTILFPGVKVINWVINGETLLDAKAITEDVAGALRTGGPITVKGRPIGEIPDSDAANLLRGIFTPDRARVRKLGCYAGWSGHKRYTVTGGPTLIKSPSGPNVELVSGTPLCIA